MRNKSYYAGILLFISGAILLMGIITGEIFYPEQYAYTTKLREISDLGSTRPPESLITEPSATIFNMSMLVSGALIVVASHLLRISKFSKFATVALSVLGLGVFFVGVFPGNRAPWHALSAMATFVSGGVSAIVTAFSLKKPYRFVFILFGSLTLIFFFFAGAFIPTLGIGGTERWVAYPVLLYILGFGGYLIGKNE